MKKYKVLFCDLDGTLIDTLSGDIFPKGIWDMRIKFDVLDAIKELAPECVLIISNQEGIEKGVVNKRNFEFKMEYIIRSIREYAKVFTEYSYCPSTDENYAYRKPNVGMLNSLLHNLRTNWFRAENITKEDCLMIGDESGLDGQFSDSDKKTAENFGIDYMDVNEFVKTMIDYDNNQNNNTPL